MILKLNKKAMTLFELLAVIVILGIIAMIAFPTVNTLINNTKKDAFAANANNFIQASITNVKSDYIANGYDTDKIYTVYGVDAMPDDDNDDSTINIDLSSDFDLTDGDTAEIVLTYNGTILTVTSMTYTEDVYTTTITLDTTEDNLNITREDVDIQ